MRADNSAKITIWLYFTVGIIGLFFFFFTPEADASDVPLLTIDRIEGNNGILKIHYTTADAEGKQLSTGDWKYSTDGGATWILIDETAIFNNAPKPAGPHILEWDTRLGLNSPSGAYLPALLFRMQVYDTEIGLGGTWQSVAPLENPRAFPNVVVWNGKIIAIRGHNRGKLANSEEYNPTVNTWQPATALPVSARIDLAAVTHNSGIYLIGGYDGKTRLTTNEFVSFQPESVQMVQPMPTARKALSAVLVNDVIYALGGDDGSSLVRSNEAYNIAQDLWETKAPMNTVRQSFAAVTLGQKIYAIGGHSNGYLATVEMYDPNRDVWRTIKSMPTARYGVAATVVGDKIYVIGGHDGTRVLNTVEVYHPATDTWSTAAPMPTARRYHGLVSIGRTIYAVGGSTDEAVLGSVEAYILPRLSDTAISKPVVLANHIQSQIRLPNQKSIEDEAKQSTEIQRVLGVVTILGRAEGSNLQSWTLDYSVAGLEPPNFTPIQFSNQPPQMSQLGQWDTTQVIDGDYQLRLRVTDTNVITVVKSINVKVDNTPPQASAIISGAGLESDFDDEGVRFIRNNAKMMVSGTTEVGAEVTAITLYAGDLAVKFTEQVEVLADGTISGYIPGRDFTGVASTYLNLEIRDETGNYSTVSSNTLIIDNDAPRIEILSPASGANFHEGQIYLSGKVADTFSGVRRIEIDSGFGWVLVDDTSNLNFNPQLTDWQYAFTPPTDDVLMDFRARATDNAGNIRISDSKTVKYMTSLPTVNLVAPVDDIQLMGKIEVLGVAAVSQGVINWLLEFAPGSNATDGWTTIIDGQANVSSDIPLAIWDTDQLPDGNYTLRLRATVNDQMASVKRTNLFKTPAEAQLARPPNRPISLPFRDHQVARLQLESGEGVQLRGSDFSDPNPLNQHRASQWQITSMPSNYEVLVFDSGRDTQNLVQIRVKKLIELNQTYYWRVRYQDAEGMWSPFSEESYFTTKPTGQFTIQLQKGLNFISLPVQPIDGMTAKTLAKKINATLIMRFDVDAQTFVPYIPDLSVSESFDLEGGIGYIVNVLATQEMTLAGTVWDNSTKPAAAPVRIDKEFSQPFWAFVMALDTNVLMSASAIEVTNLRTSQNLILPVDSGSRALASFVDLNRRPVVAIGDQIRLRALTDEGRTAFEPVTVILSDQDLQRAVSYHSVRWEPLPDQTRLLQNYPNPFNPETWIPYQLANDGFVVMNLFSSDGDPIRQLRLGHQVAGTYYNRDRAAYWDGRNGQGEQVGSGLYFYQIEVVNYPSSMGLDNSSSDNRLKKMIILK